MRRVEAQTGEMLVPDEAGGDSNRIYERRLAVPGSIPSLRRAVVGLAADSGATEEQRDCIALAISEAVTNCALHAYADRGPPGPVTVQAWESDGVLTVIVSDEGDGMRPHVPSPGLGLGQALMARMSERVEIEHLSAGGVSVRMMFPVGS